MRHTATQSDTRNVVFIPKDWGASSDGGEADSQQPCTEQSVSNPVNVSDSLVPEGELCAGEKSEHAMRLSTHAAVEQWYPGAPAPSKWTMVYLCGGQERTGDVKSYVESIKQLSFECVLIDPNAGGYAQDIRRAETCSALAEYLRSPMVFLILASPECKWFCALRGAGYKEGRSMPSGPGVLFNSDYPNGDVDMSGKVKPEAKEALLMWGIFFFSHGGGVPG
jgi:hypothetical protein